MSARQTEFSGVFGVTVTPFTADGTALDEGALGGLCEALIAEGIRHLVPCGNTGEYYALSRAERGRVLELAIESSRGRSSVILGVGGALEDAIDEARHAERAGADAVMIHHPVHPYVTEDGYLEYVRSVTRAIRLPVVPYLRGPILTSDGIRRLIDIESVVAVKFGFNDLLAFGAAVGSSDARPDVAWICGTAESWAPFFWAAGAVGFTSGLVNVIATQSLELLTALQAGDRTMAMAIWRRLRPFEELRSRRTDGWNVAVVKEAMRQVGRPAGPVRPPASDVGHGEAREIADLLESWRSSQPASRAVEALAR